MSVTQKRLRLKFPTVSVNIQRIPLLFATVLILNGTVAINFYLSHMKKTDTKVPKNQIQLTNLQKGYQTCLLFTFHRSI